MRIRAGYELVYEHPQPTPLILVVSIVPERFPDLESAHQIRFEPEVIPENYTDAFGNTCTRVLAPTGQLRIANEFIICDSGLPDVAKEDARQLPVEELSSDVLVYLLGSRYCDTDRLMNFAWATFGNTPPGWIRVQAVCDYVYRRIAFNYQNADATRCATDGHREQTGVCRDFAHLAIALCRCLNIPARYCTGYLGDIGVPQDPAPMDFSAWFEAYLEGQWYTFDARHNVPRIGRIIMGRGRDATDVAISTAFGPSELRQFSVVTEEIQEEILAEVPQALHQTGTLCDEKRLAGQHA